MKEYLDVVQDILETGVERTDRTGVGTIGKFHKSMTFDLKQGFPATTTKKLAWRAVVGELLWFLEGSDDERRLAEITFGKPRDQLKDKTTIWTANANNQAVDLGYPNNDRNKILGPIYGRQWRGTCSTLAGGSVVNFDQIAWVADEIKNNPFNRRIILNSWNANDISSMALPPCHVLAQFYVVDNTLSCLMYQRSGDMFLGVPFNIASYSLLTHMLASYSGTEVGQFIHVIGDAHIYKNHISQVREQLNRVPVDRPLLNMPKIDSFTIESIKTLSVDDFQLVGYNPQTTISAPMAV